MKYSIDRTYGGVEGTDRPFCDVNLDDNEELELDYQSRPGGKKVLYVNVNGITIFRVQFTKMNVRNELVEEGNNENP